MLGGMFLVGNWVEEQIKRGVTANAAVSTALLLDSFITPLAQELQDTDTLTIGPVLALDELLKNSSFADKVVGLRLWKPDGTVAYSDDLSLVGEKFEVSDSLKQASAGNVVSEFSLEGLLDNVEGPDGGRPLLEIYSPIRAQWTGEVIAVIEIYEDATELAQTLSEARRNTWLVVASVTISMVLVLLTIVDAGSELIGRQRQSLEKALCANKALLRRVERASGRSAELTEQQLRRVSADLHDGPAQLVSLAALRMGSLSLSRDDKKTQGEVAVISQALADAMQDIRNICNGLSLPEIENQSLTQMVNAVVGSHEARTKSHVEVRLSGGEAALAPHVKICLYRFLQEGLNNAYRHAKGQNPRIIVEVDENGVLNASVQNGLNGAADSEVRKNPKRGPGIGLRGLRERVEALGGSFAFSQSKTRGAKLQMQVNIETGTQA
ncbi:MAG TPA: sensor histidine kinase [Devosia sp.]|nr:sensor histidine kinase [Devosia sp.]